MTSPTPQALSQSGTLDELYSQLAPIRMGAGWAKPTPSLWPEPKKSFQPFVWSYAQAKGRVIDQGRHRVLKAPHPSPLSAHRGFIGGGHFSAANAYLSRRGAQPIDWSLPPRAQLP